MKISKTTQFFAGLALALSLTTNAFAQSEGGTGSHGGDPRLIDEGKIKNFILNKMRDELTKTILYVDTHFSDDDIYKDQVAKLIARGIEEDIRVAPFQFKEKCVDYKGKLKGATALMNKQQSPVCWSLSFLASRQPTESDLIGIGFHEFAHHFGIKDDDHSLAAAFKASYLARLQSAKKSQKGAGLLDNASSSFKNSCVCENSGDFDQDLIQIQTYSDGTTFRFNLGTYKKPGYTTFGINESCPKALKRRKKECGNE